MSNLKLSTVCSQLAAVDDDRALDPTIKASMLAGGMYLLPGARSLSDQITGKQYAMVALWCVQRYRTMTWERAILQLRKDANLRPGKVDNNLCGWISNEFAKGVAHEDVTYSQESDFIAPVVAALAGRREHFDPDIAQAMAEMRQNMPRVIEQDLLAWKGIRNRGDFDKCTKDFTNTYGFHRPGNNGNGNSSRRSDALRGGPFALGDPSTAVSDEDSQPTFPPLPDGVPNADGSSVFADDDEVVLPTADDKQSVFEQPDSTGDDAALIEDAPGTNGGFVGVPAEETATATKAGRKSKGDAKDGDPSHY